MERWNFLTHLRKILLARRRVGIERKEVFTYAALGDSTVEGIGASDPAHTYASLVHTGIDVRFKHTKFYNFGKSGARVEDVITDQLNQAIATKPDLITLSVGANDIVHSTRLSAFRREYEALIRRLRTETNAIIVVTNVPNFSLTPAVPRRLKLLADLRIRRVNATIRAIVRRYDAILIDAYEHGSLFMRQFPDEVIFEDGFHPSNLGYALWANTILTILADKL